MHFQVSAITGGVWDFPTFKGTPCTFDVVLLAWQISVAEAELQNEGVCFMLQLRIIVSEMGIHLFTIIALGQNMQNLCEFFLLCRTD